MSDQGARRRLALALDVGDLDAATAMAKRLSQWFGIAKVGLELYAEAGPAAFDRMHALGFAVFADLKLHDIPTTVERASRAIARRGVEFLNFHACGGDEMVRAAVEGGRAGARDAGLAAPALLAVTVLTSDADVGAFDERLDRARREGCDGVVCAADEVGRARAAGLRSMVPGVRLADAAVDDQARVATPAEVIAAGGDWLVVGRTVTAAASPEGAAEAVVRDVAAALEGARS